MQMCSTKYVYTNLAKSKHKIHLPEYLRLFWQVININAQKGDLKCIIHNKYKMQNRSFNKNKSKHKIQLSTYKVILVG